MPANQNPVFVDGTTITGDGTEEHPLQATGGGGGGLQFLSVMLSSAQLLNMGATGNTPVEIIPAPGAGKVAIPMCMQVQGIPGSTPYTCPTNADVILYPAGDVEAFCPADITAADSYSGTAGFDTLVPVLAGGEMVFGTLGASDSLANLENKAWVMQTSQGGSIVDITDGNGSAVVNVWYLVFDVV